MEQIRDTTKNRFSDIVKALKVPDLRSIPCFFKKRNKWSAAEELVLLSALQTFGYGNWKVIADTLSKVCKKVFSSLEVQKHYNDIYLEGEIGKAIRCCDIPHLKNSLVDHTLAEDEALLSSCDMEAHLKLPAEFLEKIGYMPLREDFVMESKANPENILKEVRFKDNMDDFDQNLNLLMLDAYRNTVKQRILEKKIIRALRLVEKYHEFYPCRKRSAKFNNNWMPLYESTKLQKLPNYFRLLFQRLTKDGQKKNSKFSLECSDVSSSLIASIFSEKLKHDFYEELNARPLKRKKLSVKKEDSEVIDLLNEIHRRSPRRHASSRKWFVPESKSEMKLIIKLRRILSPERELERMNASGGSSSLAKYSLDESSNDVNSSLFNHGTTKLPLIYLYPCVEYLTQDDRRLCQKLNLQPLFFIYYKTFLMKEDLLRRSGKNKSSNLIPEGLDMKEATQIYNYLKSQNCIKSSFDQFY